LKQEHIGKIGGYLYGPGQMIVGTSPAMRQLYRKIDQVAPTTATVLLRGESGTGKELIARAIHYDSPRCEREMIAVNCGAIPAELIESELFGYAQGAFTGAISAKMGLFEAASGSTLFLDEMGGAPRSAY
jgi:transcriptional regulator with GAF, ATPase, and Fis domain